MMKKRILITGGAGFLGSHLCDRFIREGYHVIAMDNLITGDLRNIEHLFQTESFEFYHHDVTKFITYTGAAGLHFAFCFAGQPNRLPENSNSDTEGWCNGHA
jgi:dTDP-glucose 4,6-dehydratase